MTPDDLRALLSREEEHFQLVLLVEGIIRATCAPTIIEPPESTEIALWLLDSHTDVE